MNCNYQTIRSRPFTIDIHLQIETDILLGYHLVTDRESESFFQHQGFIGSKVRARSRILCNGNIFIRSCQYDRDIAYWIRTYIHHNDTQRNGLSRIQDSVIVTLWVVDLIRVIILDSTHLNGFHSSQHIHATKTIGVALACSQRDCCFLKDAADV